MLTFEDKQLQSETPVHEGINAIHANTDVTAPTITARDTADLDGDGFIDAVHITFDEAVLDASVTAANFHVAGIAGEAFNSFTNGDTADDGDIYITFTDGTLATDAVPTVTYTAGTLTDLSGNPLATTGAVASTDAAAPVLLSATSTAASTALTVTFSEPVDTSNAGAGDLVTLDFVYGDLSTSGTSAMQPTPLQRSIRRDRDQE